MPLRHDPSEEALFGAVLRTHGDPERLARVGAEAARRIRRRRARRHVFLASAGLATAGILALLLHGLVG